MKLAANILTGLRILLSLILCFVKTFGYVFCFIYILCGISDMLDGFIARKFSATSRFGEVFDSIADLIFAAICLIKILPVLELELHIFILVGLICFVKVVFIGASLVRFGKVEFPHNIANRVAGLLAFLLPLTLKFTDVNISSLPALAAAVFAAFYELYGITIKKQGKNNEIH